MSRYTIQRLGFDGQRRRWFDVESTDCKRAAIRAANLFAWGASQSHRVVDDVGAVVWPEDTSVVDARGLDAARCK